MALSMNGTDIPTNGDFIYWDGKPLKKVMFNGTVVWEKRTRQTIFEYPDGSDTPNIDTGLVSFTDDFSSKGILHSGCHVNYNDQMGNDDFSRSSQGGCIQIDFSGFQEADVTLKLESTNTSDGRTSAVQVSGFRAISRSDTGDITHAASTDSNGVNSIRFHSGSEPGSVYDMPVDVTFTFTIDSGNSLYINAETDITDDNSYTDGNGNTIYAYTFVDCYVQTYNIVLRP